jgi:hypothetical protein
LLEDEEGGSAVAVLSALHDSLLSTWFAQARWAETAFKQRAPIVVAHALANALSQLDPPVHTVLNDRLSATADQLSALCVLRKVPRSFFINLVTRHGHVFSVGGGG